MKALSEISESGCTIEDGMMRVSEGISLRVITFNPRRDRENPTIVFVAGWISHISGWTSVLKEMTRDFRVVYVETREKKSSVAPRGAGYGVQEIGDDLIKIIEHLGLREHNYVMLGSSLGATAVIDCYSRLPKKPLALVLIGPNAEFRVPFLWKLIVKLFYPPLYALVRPSVKWYLKNFRLDVTTDREQFDKYSDNLNDADPWKLKKAVLAVERYKIWDRLGDVDCPALLIGASKDVLHEPENLKAIASRLIRSTTIDLETNKSTHNGRVVEEVRKFLASLSPGESPAISFKSQVDRGCRCVRPR
jgi:pimeloyl-ACP methyl ester carboxylesterase